VGALQSGADNASSSFVTGMYQVKNNRRLAKQLLAYVCARPAIIVDLCDAAAFIDMHGERTKLWVTAETAVRCADRNLGLIDEATTTLESALRREGMLDQQLVSFADHVQIATGAIALQVTAMHCQAASPDWA
jgi:hypothetical protein